MKLPAFVVIVLGCGLAPGQETLPSDMGPAEGSSLIKLAKNAMREFMLRRTGSADQVIPSSIGDKTIRLADGTEKKLRELDYAVTLTLRDKGAVKAIAHASEGDLCRNVIAASLKAMRSPHLPDIITTDLLDTLEFELEIAGPETEIPAGKIPEEVTPGLTGLSLYVGDLKATVLPSKAYLLDFDAKAMADFC